MPRGPPKDRKRDFGLRKSSPWISTCPTGLLICFFLLAQSLSGCQCQLLEEGLEERDVGKVRVGGYVGCQISPSVCLGHEYCHNDGLFGICRSYDSVAIPVPKYKLTVDELSELATLLQKLAELGYKWRHFYTQCSVTSLLLTYKGEAVLDPSICETVTRLLSTPKIEFPAPPQNPFLVAKDMNPTDYDLDSDYSIQEFPQESMDDILEDYPQSNDYSSFDDRFQQPIQIDRNYYERNSIDKRNSKTKKSFTSSVPEDEELSYDIDYIDEILNGLSKQDIDILKKMILEEARDTSIIESAEEKRSPIIQEIQQYPDMVAKVQVNYNPPEEEDVEEEYGVNEEGDTAGPESPYNMEDGSENFLKFMHPDLSKEFLKDNSARAESYDYYDRNELKDNVYYYDRDDEKLNDAAVTTVIPAGEKEVSPPFAFHGPLHVPQSFGSAPRNVNPDSLNDGEVKSNPLILAKEPVMIGRNRQKYLITMFILCGIVAALIMAATILYFMRRQARFHNKITQWSKGPKDDVEATGEYQDLCRAHMQSKLSEKVEPVRSAVRKSEAIPPAAVAAASAAAGVTSAAAEGIRTTSTGSSSTSSWSEEPAPSNMDISTGHLVLSYMENHLQNKDRLQKEWDMLCAYDPEPCSIVAAIEPTNMRKNRYTDILPYEHCRVKLNIANSVSNSDYINASNIMDHDPRNPAYIVTQGPLPHTVADFWQMVWEQGSVVIINLTRLAENSVTICNRYWPEECSDLYHIYEVHLVSEHSWSDDYVVRSFYLKNLQTNETRTITQFHFLSWPNLGVPNSAKALLEFRRKVNKSYKGRSCPVIVHCSDGAGRSGTYCLIDMVLNRLSKGAKEIDISATLEHIRDQRVNMVKTKEQFEFALSSVAQEVHTMLQSPAS